MAFNGGRTTTLYKYSLEWSYRIIYSILIMQTGERNGAENEAEKTKIQEKNREVALVVVVFQLVA